MNKTSDEKIYADVVDDATMNDLKIQRAAGEINPEILSMCNTQVDQMLESTKNSSTSWRPEELEEAAQQIKDDQELLIAVTMFEDTYIELLKWNKLIRENKLEKNVVLRHREINCAFFKKVGDIVHAKNLSDAIFALIYHHGHTEVK